MEDKELERAINKLKANYKRAKIMKHINKPVAWALYRTWRMVDTEEKSKNKDEEE